MALFPCRSTDIAYQEFALKRLDRSMGLMRGEGIPETATPFQTLISARSQVQAHLGFKIPRNVSSLVKLYGLSPGTIELWHDDESGFFTDARARPGAPPVYKHVEEEVAMIILKGELTPELEEQLLTPDVAIDN